MLYPLTFEPNYKDYIWGGRRLESFGKILPESGNVAESWELSAHPNGMSVVAEGELRGERFQDLIDRYGEELLGSGLSERDQAKFPLLIKLIDAKNDLSIQVHPNDTYAHEHENGEYGKNEMWIVLEAPEGAQLVAGMKPGVTRDDFARAIEEDRVLECMNYVDVQAGDVINIPAGLVHAITSGLIIYEVQQNSDTTYRVFDYNRPGTDGKLRPLHVDKALDVIRFDGQPPVRITGQVLGEAQEAYERRLLVANRYFAVERVTVQDTMDDATDGTRFFTYTVTKGEGSFSYTNPYGETETLALTKGRTLFLPASLGAFTWTSSCGDEPLELIKSYIPDWSELTREIEAAGGTMDALETVVGVEPRP